jgi:hypothetical protein
MFDHTFDFPRWSDMCSNNRHGSGHACNRIRDNRYAAGRPQVSCHGGAGDHRGD